MDKCQDIVVPSCLNSYIVDDMIIEDSDHKDIRYFLHNIVTRMHCVTDEKEFDSLETILICYTMRYATIYRICMSIYLNLNQCIYPSLIPHIFSIPLDEISSYHIEHGHILAYFESIVNSIHTLKKHNYKTSASQYITTLRKYIIKYAQICICEN